LISTKILTAEDTPAEAEMLSEFLGAQGYQVINAYDGIEAIVKARVEQPDLLLLDVRMPKLDGFEVCRKLKSDPRTANIPIFMLTGAKEISERVRGLKLGAEDYLIKPYDFEELAARIAARLRAKRSADALRQAQQRVREIFERYVAPPVVERLMKHPDASQLDGVRQMITAVYVAFRGYAALAETLQPEKLIQVLNRHLSVAARAAINHQGLIDKFTGHTLMAIFNAPLPQADHALRAIRAAAELQESLQMFYRSIRPGDRLECAIGVSTGEAVVGDVGIDEIANYTAIGDAVILAQCIEEATPDGQIVFNDATYRRVSDFVECAGLGLRQLRGRSRAVDLFRFVGFKQQIATLHA
jgi:class 3 adenylate cyclase